MTREEFESLTTQARDEYKADVEKSKKEFDTSYRTRLIMSEDIINMAREYKAMHKKRLEDMRKDYIDRLREIELAYRTSRQQRGVVSRTEFNKAVQTVYRFISQGPNDGIKVVCDVDKYIDIQIHDRDDIDETAEGEVEP